jgi:hypothetical protein
MTWNVREVSASVKLHVKETCNFIADASVENRRCQSRPQDSENGRPVLALQQHREEIR